MSSIINFLHATEAFEKLAQAVSAAKTPVLASGVIDSQKCHVMGSLLTALRNRHVLIVTHSELKAREIYEDMGFFLRENATRDDTSPQGSQRESRVKFYPAKDIIFYASSVRSSDIIKQRFSVIKSLLDGEDFCIVLSAEALMDKLSPKDAFSSAILNLCPGMELGIEQLSRKLVRMGYERVDLVEAPGHFAVRGGIVDVYTTMYDNAIRVDFFGDEVDNIKLLDTYSQRSIEKLRSAIIYPMRDLVYDKKCLDAALGRMRDEFDTMYGKLKKSRSEQAEALHDYVRQVLEEIEHSSIPLDEFITFFYPQAEGLCSYLPKDTLVFIDEPDRVGQHMENVYAEFTQSIQNRILSGRLLPSQTDMVFDCAKIMSAFERFPLVLMASMAQTTSDFVIRAKVDFIVKSLTAFQYSTLAEDVKYWRDNDYHALILAGSRFAGQKLAEEITELGFSSRYTEDIDEELKPRLITVTRGALKAGFEYPNEKLAVVPINHSVIEKKKRLAKSKNTSKINSFTDLRVGDYVVHENHGIGVYEGIERITIDNISRDYIKLSYADNGKLYIQTSQMDMVQKYIGGEGVKIKPSKLNSSEWGKAKTRAKKAIADLARDLVKLYAKRQNVKGFTYAPDTVWQKEFEETFPFSETDDQLSAIDDVKRDMENGKVMDRLICGDVGYGKTEVALRAAFKCAQEGRQVAYLAPTTILAQQHYNTFSERMKDFPVNVEMLSRFRTSGQITETLARLSNGMCDIVIGTHRLLSKDVAFKDLGLIIVDEEQRFGVTHKEKLKNLRENVNVLTLTATPIPRTLHMSLTGIRDMSVLEEPPQERQPIQTYVMEFTPEFVHDAISRELSRGGQVYYLHNRVMNIVEEAYRVQNLLPEATVAFAHGQMSKRELENIMMRFISGQIDVLVCTTIIETGLDIPNVNTIIVQDADYMGLAQLYQLRGRVGRSNRLAYAYLMYRRDKVLTEVSEKRLQTIREFTEFGSGFKIAMRDLEIRGAGNLLGAEQHGHMNSVGYDLYCKMLAEAVAEMRGEVRTEDFETHIDLPISAYIPQEYIENEEQKLEIYKKISAIGGERDYYDVQEEIEDRYGDLPQSVTNLLKVALLKATAHQIGALGVSRKNHNLVITLKPDANIDGAKLIKSISTRKNLYFSPGPTPLLTYKTTGQYALDLDDLRKTMEEIAAG
ncbi:MAG: transcription-repair coupling factor [Clostridiales bacterium]|jgi:transcription-repair coupling factor (superfamily II helicase)|nr:transcription-repair coupling factor [Clostridiales bacterium]